MNGHVVLGSISVTSLQLPTQQFCCTLQCLDELVMPVMYQCDLLATIVAAAGRAPSTSVASLASAARLQRATQKQEEWTVALSCCTNSACRLVGSAPSLAACGSPAPVGLTTNGTNRPCGRQAVRPTGPHCFHEFALSLRRLTPPFYRNSVVLDWSVSQHARPPALRATAAQGWARRS